MTSTWLIFGLGNPGGKYRDTYHNVGFRVTERLAERFGVRIRERCGPALVSGPVLIGGQTAVLVQPHAYMNRSGTALPALIERVGSGISALVVVYDDLALPLGRVRVRRKGSAGGHNGIESLILTAGTDEFIRVRVGIRPEREIGGTRDFVLSGIADADRELLEDAESAAADAVERVLAGGVEEAMSAFNGIDLRLAGRGNRSIGQRGCRRHSANRVR